MSNPFRKAAPAPKSALGYHRVLAPTAGVRVSPLCLGTMNFGTEWEAFMGECSKESAFAILDAFYENGGNFIDTSNNYQFEQAEQWIGEWMKARGNRDQIVLATKFTANFRAAHFDKEPIQSNFSGNSMKSMHISLKKSLEKLQTDYIDLFYVHWWDLTTGVEEVMHGLNSLITAGKVLYLGISDTPAWVVVKANDYARTNGLRQFSVYQGKWNASFRDMERELIPMCRDQGMGIAPWAALGQGRFKSAAARQTAHTGAGRAAQLSENEIRVSDALESVANRKNTSLHAVALAYILQKTPYVFPIIGQRKVDHLLANIEALSIEMTFEDIEHIDSAIPFDPGFPYNFLVDGKYDLNVTSSNLWATKLAGRLDSVEHQRAIRPHKE
ncbi:aldo/keto reductase, putative [Talaromyces stipitatus ATCC 10500]|uniref:Aldo/keto reductase, putative n=1 Tax=Talaromyces stipitatus (strain ATCC 10500 / CBS 375.48 / QM 6759 / NRRL 1006) TaxID=441959 RepID=B8MBB1_TALSN|nr:aldo/keto reductase, putative [Talaromyces stipitatus ATCC 10500]EED18900.1 aldo/keto reductase, putative [Talaromyces stipitatus ATCC 10500]